MRSELPDSKPMTSTEYGIGGGRVQWQNDDGQDQGEQGLAAGGAPTEVTRGSGQGQPSDRLGGDPAGGTADASDRVGPPSQKGSPTRQSRPPGGVLGDVQQRKRSVSSSGEPLGASSGSGAWALWEVPGAHQDPHDNSGGRTPEETATAGASGGPAAEDEPGGEAESTEGEAQDRTAPAAAAPSSRRTSVVARLKSAAGGVGKRVRDALRRRRGQFPPRDFPQISCPEVLHEPFKVSHSRNS